MTCSGRASKSDGAGKLHASECQARQRREIRYGVGHQRSLQVRLHRFLHACE
jgi:hypothetical protein